MKRLLTVVLAVALAALLTLSLAACNENTGTPTETSAPAADTTEAPVTEAEATEVPAADAADVGIVGTWEYEYGSFIYTFKADGTGTYDIAGDTMNFTYETNDNVLSITFEGDTGSSELEYEIDGDKLNVKDSFGSDTIYYRK